MDYQEEKAHYEKQRMEIIQQVQAWAERRCQVEGVIAYLNNKIEEQKKEVEDNGESG